MTVGAEDDRVCALIGIAPPVNKYQFASVKLSPKPKFVVHGDHDELIPLKLVRQFYAQLRTRRSSSRSTAPITCSTARQPKSATRSKISSRISHARRSNRLRRPHGGRQGAERGAEDRRPDEMAATVIAEALRRAPGVDPSEIDDVMLGCAMPEAEQGLNVARIASLRAGVPVSASAVTINRFCSSGLQAIAYAAERMMCGFAEASSPAAPSR